MDTTTGNERGGLCAFATKGTGSNEERRLMALLEGTGAAFLPYDKSAKRSSLRGLIREIDRRRPRLLAMEGTGLAGGLACFYARLRYGTGYVVSSGDAVGPFVASRAPWTGPVFGWYERLLCRFAAGFIGWTPYLVGRAMTYGCRRAVTAPGWSFTALDEGAWAEARLSIRRRLGIGEDELVFGILGAISWNPAKGYCYGKELVEAVKRVDRPGLRVLIVGDGDGRSKLEALAGELLGDKVLMPGRVPLEEVVHWMAAMDVGSLPQSTDPVGAFRYTTKISEYRAARLPVAISRVPMAYDLDEGWLWRLPGETPWDESYVAGMAELMRTVDREAVEAKRGLMEGEDATFTLGPQQARVRAWIGDVMERERRRRGEAEVKEPARGEATGGSTAGGEAAGAALS